MEHNSKYSISRENTHHYIPGNRNPKSFFSIKVHNIALNNKKNLLNALNYTKFINVI